MKRGAFCLVLHGHLPWVMHHGRWPHGEDWLYEAASETWLPLLEVLDTCAEEGIRPAWSLGLTPILLEQLTQESFQIGFRRYLGELVSKAERDHAEFTERGESHLAWLAERHAGHARHQLEVFERIGGQLVAAFVAHARAGRIELLSSNATHGYHPLILHDACSRAQIRAGVATSERHFGLRPKGVWLPECAYRPPGPWLPPVVHGDVRQRAGVGGMYADEGVRYLCVDSHLIEGSVPEAIIDGDRVTVVDWDPWTDGRCWGTVLEPLRVVEAGVVTELTVLGRCTEVAEKVWNAEHGYPGDGRYLEFHKRHGLRGLRYWKVTSRKADLGSKLAYHPPDAEAAAHTHADHFVHQVCERIIGHHEGSGGRFGVVCTPFDAELFGHWWAEGPQFLLDVARQIHGNDDVQAMTMSEYLAKVPADKAAALPEGSWGAEGDHRVWLTGETRMGWSTVYRAEDRFLDLWHRADWRANAQIRTLLSEAGRQLLLLEASDWPFVISTQGAIDYGTRRIAEHAGRFDDLCNGVEDLCAGREPDPVTLATLEFCRIADPVFPTLDLGWWS